MDVYTTRWQSLLTAIFPVYDQRTIVQNRKPLNNPHPTPTPTPMYLFLRHHLINKTESYGMLKVYLCLSYSY